MHAPDQPMKYEFASVGVAVATTSVNGEVAYVCVHDVDVDEHVVYLSREIVPVPVPVTLKERETLSAILTVTTIGAPLLITLN